MPDTVFADAFRIERAIGEGAMGTVYRAERIDKSGPCALKVLKPSVSDRDKATERFDREARVGDAINHPHVVEVFDAGFDEHTGLHWLAMEYLEGLPLPEYLAERQPSRAVRLALLTHLFGAIAAAHRVGVLHRDLKPDNLFVVEGGDAPMLKVLDFGVAKTMRHGLMASATEGGLGTPLWTAPEQGKGGDHVRPSVDVWALGLLTFYLLTGKIYWFHCNDEKASMLDIATEMLRDDIAPASVRAEQLDCAAALPSGFDPWFSRCVVRDAELRYGDAAEAVMEWQRVLAGQPLVGKSTPPPATSSPPLVSIPSAPPPHSVVSRSEPPETIRSLYPEAHRPRNIVFAALAAVLAGIVAAAAAWMWLT